MTYLFEHPKGVLSAIELSIFSRFPIGKNIFDLDWEIAIILDTCRVDALKQVSEQYEFIDEVNSMISVGAATPEWVSNTFTSEYESEVESTAYVTGNGFVEAILSETVSPEGHEGANFAPTNWDTVGLDEFELLDLVWRSDDICKSNTGEQYYAQAQTVADHAISYWRQNNYDRMIVHFVEPHHPYLQAKQIDSHTDDNSKVYHPFRYLQNDGDFNDVWQYYISELRAGLDGVRSLIENVDANRVLITADHGETFGEYYEYHHRSGSINPYLRKVPVVWTAADNLMKRSPSVDTSNNRDKNESIRSHLSALGYM